MKPGFFINPELAELAFEYRLLFIGLWTLADREGRLEDRPKRIKMALFAADNVDCETGVRELAAAGFITRYSVQGVAYIQILNWHKHQTPHPREQASTIPAVESMSKDITPIPCMGEPRTDLGSTKEIASPSDVLIPSSLSPSDSLGSKAPPAKKPPDGTRLSPDWQLPDDWVAEAQRVRPGFTPALWRQVADGFRDYWVSIPGAKGRKTDWLATWRNWARTENRLTRGSTGPPEGKTAKQREAEQFMQSIGGGGDGNGSGQTLDGTARRVTDPGD